MGRIFCLMGKSSSGKDTIFKLLKDDLELNLKPIISYTTRPKRNNETDGIEYYFIDEDIIRDYAQSGKIIEKRVYNTVEGIWYYCTIDDGQIDLTTGNYLFIATLDAYKNLKHYFGAENVVPIYITADDGLRLQRSLVREKQQQNPNFEEVCRRFLADNEDFSAENLINNQIAKSYVNHNLQECVSEIKQDLLKSV